LTLPFYKFKINENNTFGDTMRMRKKKYLKDRLLAVSDILFKIDTDDRNFNTAILEKEYIDLEKWFGNDKPIYLEIGCGKGKFSVEYAKTHPEINLVAVEKSDNVIVSACESAKEQGVDNVRFICGSAEYLEKFIREKSIGRLFLNFSCPYPKNTYASHRLTHRNFLKIYKNLLCKGAEIHQKTDNMGLFEFSIEEFSQSGFALKNVSLDLHNSDFEGNIMTEYETRFVNLGQPIYRLEAYLND
jgi:tRNA (guanine-N7-)-methyltransferase